MFSQHVLVVALNAHLLSLRSAFQPLPASVCHPSLKRLVVLQLSLLLFTIRLYEDIFSQKTFQKIARMHKAASIHARSLL